MARLICRREPQPAAPTAYVPHGRLTKIAKSHMIPAASSVIPAPTAIPPLMPVIAKTVITPMVPAAAIRTPPTTGSSVLGQLVQLAAAAAARRAP